jgi:hypothetical protein
VKADLTRSTFRPEKHYRSVRMQQGRVQLDADWNEQVDIVEHLDETTRIDVIGRCGAPEANAGFGIDATPGGADLTISPGRLYVDGIVCELEASPVAVTAAEGAGVTVEAVVLDGRELQPDEWVALSTPEAGPFVVKLTSVEADSLTLEIDPALTAEEADALGASDERVLQRVTTVLTQPDPPGDPAVDSGTYLAYLDVWERLRTTLEDDGMRESALQGADTATRTQTVWQVRLHRLGDVDDSFSCSNLPDFDSFVEPANGRLRVRTPPAGESPDPCQIPAAVGFRGLEHQLTRLEVHDGGAPGTATYKSSRDNGSVVVAWLAQDGANLTVSGLGRDDRLGLRPGDWVELTDDSAELRGEPGRFAKVEKAEGQTLTIEQPNPPVAIADFPVNPKVRRWDDPLGPRPVETPADNDGFVKGADGLEWRFEGNRFETGDYWLVPARSGIGIEWPSDSTGRPLALPPEGVEHHYCALAILRQDDGWEVLSDCRKPFPPLTGLDGAAEDPGIHVVGVETGGGATLRNDAPLELDALVEGIRILCDADVEPGTLRGVPTCLVTLDLPYPFLGQDLQLWGVERAFGTFPVTLDAVVTSGGPVIHWQPAASARALLEDNQLFAGLARHGIERDRVLAHLTLKGNFVYADGDPGVNVDGEVFGELRDGVLDVQLPRSGDGRRGGDLELWFWLVRAAGGRFNFVVAAAFLQGLLLDSPGRRAAGPEIVAAIGDRPKLREVAPEEFALHLGAARDPDRARQAATGQQLVDRELRVAVEEPLAPVANVLAEQLAAELGVRLQLTVLPPEVIVNEAAGLEADGFDLALAGRETIDKANANRPNTFPVETQREL